MWNRKLGALEEEIEQKIGVNMKQYFFQAINVLLLFSCMVSHIPLAAVQEVKQSLPSVNQQKTEVQEVQQMAGLVQRMSSKAQEIIRLIDESEIIASKGPTGVYNTKVTRIGTKLFDITWELLEQEVVGTWDKFLKPMGKMLISYFAKTAYFIDEFRAKKIRASDFKLSQHNLRVIRFLLKVFVLLANMMKVMGVYAAKPLALLLGMLIMIIYLAANVSVILAGTAIVYATGIINLITLAIISIGMVPGGAAKGALGAVRAPRSAVRFLNELRKKLQKMVVEIYEGALVE